MITKEKKTELLNKKINDVDELKNIKKWNRIIVIIIALFVILSFIVLYVFKINNMSIYNPYEVKILTVKSEMKDWNLNENINLFQQSNKNGEKLIYPGESGKYEFIIENSNSTQMYYNIRLSEENKDKINIKYKLKMNNIYIVGDENTYETIDKFNLEKVNIMGNTKILYTLEWKWQESDNDLQLIKDGLATYRIYIDICSKYSGELYENN